MTLPEAATNEGDPEMTDQTIMAAVERSRHRMLGALHDLHAQRDPDCHVWEQWTIPAAESKRMPVEGCRKHDILISSR